MFKFAAASLFGFGFAGANQYSSSVSSSSSSSSTTTSTNNNNNNNNTAECVGYLPPYPTVENNSVVFLDITATKPSWVGSASSTDLGRIEIELFDDTVPLTARNFRSLCKGDLGLTPDGEKLHYKHRIFHRIIPGFCAQFGSFDNVGRKGGSIYGRTFKDESFKGKAGRHVQAGMLSMANSGPNSNSSQAFFTLKATPWLDGKHICFGQIVKGFEVLKEIEKFGSETGAVQGSVSIRDCGIVRETPVTPIRYSAHRAG